MNFPMQAIKVNFEQITSTKNAQHLFRPLSPALSFLLVLSLALACPSAVLAKENVASASVKPNVIVVLTDDQGYGDIAVLGNRMIKTPHIDDLHNDSVRLTNFHVDPTCAPSRAAVLTGRYSTRTGVWHTLAGRSLMSPDETTLGEVFQANGYRTAMFGKWHLGDNYPLRPEDQGFDHVIRIGGGGVNQTPDYWENDNFDDTYWVNSKPTPYKGYSTDIFFNETMSFINESQAKKQPFFIYLATNAPHSPFTVAERYSKPYLDKGVPKRMSSFYGMITNIDDNLGRLMAHLKKIDLDDNTILVFMSDNGTSGGLEKSPEAGEWQGFNAGMRATKGSNYEGGHRVPFFIRWPNGEVKGGRDVNTMTAHLDLMPTLVDLAELNMPDSNAIDGMSLKPLLTSTNAGDIKWPNRTLVVHSQKRENPKKWSKFAVMNQRWRLTSQTELYDITLDAGQKNNVANQYPEVVKSLTAQYESWWKTLTPEFEKVVTINIGNASENPSRLTAHDWHADKKDKKAPWNQKSIRKNVYVNGYWIINVERDGDYEFKLYQWDIPGDKALDAVTATLEVGGQQQHVKVDKGARFATIKMSLKAGPQRMKTWMLDSKGKERGAFYVYVEKR